MKLEKVKTGMYYSPKLNMMIQIWVTPGEGYSCMYGGYDPQTKEFKGFYGTSDIAGNGDEGALRNNWKCYTNIWGPITLIEEGDWSTWVMQL